MFNFTEANESVYNILQQNQLLNILIAIVIFAFVLFLHKNTGSKMLKQKALFLLLIIILILNTRIPLVIIIIPICAILYILKFLMSLLCEYIQAKQNVPAQQTIQSSIGGQSNITSTINSTTSLSSITPTNRNGIFTIQMPSSESPYTQPSSANTSKSTSDAQIPYRLLPAVSNTPYTNYNYNQDISPGYSYNQPTTSRSTAKQTSAIHSTLQPPTPLAQPVSRINTPQNVTRNVKDAANIVPYTTPLDLNEYSDLFDRKYDHDFQSYHHIIKSQTFYQAGKLYRRPYGCIRIGINLTRDRFAHEWIKNWHNAYHGTSEENIISIIKQGFKPGLGK